MEVKISWLQKPFKILVEVLEQSFSTSQSKIKNLTRSQKGRDIIYKTERKLLNERIRNINGTIQCYEHERYMYQHKLKELIDEEMWTSGMAEINRVKEWRNEAVMKRQISKLNKPLQLKNCEDQNQGGHSNHQNGCSNQDDPEMTNIAQKKWVINLSSTPLLRNKNHSWHMVQTLQWPPMDLPMVST